MNESKKVPFSEEKKALDMFGSLPDVPTMKSAAAGVISL